MDDYIKIPDLKEGHLYQIEARNASYGIWIADEEGFAISRIKFGDNFMFVEYHWDCQYFATAKPIKEIEKSPFKSEDFYSGAVEKEALEYLNKFEGLVEKRASEGKR